MINHSFQVYVISITWSDNSVVVIFRRYSRFFDLQVFMHLKIHNNGKSE